MSDHISLRGLAVDAVVGCRPDERLAPRPVTIDLDIFADLRVPGATDDIVDTVDYDALARRIREVVVSKERALIEAIAEDVAQCCLATTNVRTVTVTVHKPGAVAGCSDIAVTISR